MATWLLSVPRWRVFAPIFMMTMDEVQNRTEEDGVHKAVDEVINKQKQEQEAR